MADLPQKQNLVAVPSGDSITATSANSTSCTLQKWRKWMSFASAILSCLCAGSILLFSLWAPIFQQKLGYSQMQVNAISITGELGMYLLVPIFGYICDNCGPDKLSTLSALFFGPGYFLASLAYSRDLPYQVMVVAFGLIGMGTSSMYFSAVTTCAKNFTGSRGLALSLPIASFGLSSVWESQVVARVFVDESGALLVRGAFVAFAVLLTSVGVLGGLCLKVFPTEEESTEEETERLLQSSDNVENGYGSTPDTTPESSPRLNSATREFLFDKTMWLFALGIFLATGPGEAFINNMGTLLTTLTATPPNPATHVSIIAATSTASRILAGLLSDYLAPSVTSSRPQCSRIVLLVFSAALLFSAELLLALGVFQGHADRFWVVSALMGAGYGAVFTLAPTVVSVVWGTKNFGTNWGIVCMTPAVGATAYGVLYAAVYDCHSGDDGGCVGVGCYRGSFAVMAVGTGVAVGGWVWAWRGRGGWRGKGVVV